MTSALKVANKPLREAFLASNLTAADVARRMGWDCGHGADTSRVRRKLGILPETATGRNERYGPRHSHHIDVEHAEALGEILGVAPWELEP